LAKLVANVHGELETLADLGRQCPEHEKAIVHRTSELERNRDALYATLKQFDPELDPTAIGTRNDWMRTYGKIGTKTALRRYVEAMNS
jgi:hypothetical protein